MCCLFALDRAKAVHTLVTLLTGLAISLLRNDEQGTQPLHHACKLANETQAVPHAEACWSEGVDHMLNSQHDNSCPSAVCTESVGSDSINLSVAIAPVRRAHSLHVVADGSIN